MKNLFRIVFHIIIMFKKKKKSHQIYIVYEDGNFIGFSTFPQFTYYEGLWDVFFFFDEYIENFFFLSSCKYNIPNWIYIVKIIDIGLYSKYTRWRYLLVFSFLYTLHYYRILNFIYFIFDRKFVEFALNNLIGFMLKKC